MDLGTPIGMVVCFVAIVVGMILLQGDVMALVDIPSVALVVIPTFGALFVAFPASQIAALLKHFPIVLGLKKYDPLEYVNMIVSMAEIARTNGLMALETQANEVEDTYVKAAAQMVADATEADVIEERLSGILESSTERHARSWALYEKGAAFAPAFGMCATVVSLVNMLMNLNFSDAGGAASLGINMATALITTLYGSLVANVFFIPLSNKLRLSHQAEMACKNLVIVGFLAIQKGTNPRGIKDMLIERLDPKIASKIATD